MEASKALTLLSEAVAFAIARAESAKRALDSVTQLVGSVLEGLEQQAKKTGVGSDAAKNQAHHQAIEKDAKTKNEYESHIRQLGMLLGPLSGPAMETAANDFDRKVRDLNEAQRLGILSEGERGSVVKELEAEYRNLKAAALGQQVAGNVGRQLVQAMTSMPGQAGGFAADQLTGVATGLMGLVKNLPIAGGMFGLMLYGNSERDRLKAEAGEITNLVVAAGGSAHSAGIGYFSAFQERAQKFYAMSRGEVQGTLKVFFDGGMTVEDVLSVQHKSLGEAGHDAMTTTLALDKHFEMAGGTAARGAMQMVKNNGLAIGAAVDQMTKLSFAGQRAGGGVQAFTDASIKTAQELRNYGVDGEQVGSMLILLQGKLQDMGINAATAMGLARAGMQEASQGFQGMSIGMKAHLGEEMGLGEGMTAAYKMQDMVGSQDPHELVRMMLSMNRVATKTTDQAGGGDIKKRAWLEGAGFGFEGARSITMVTSLLGTDGKLKDLTAKEWTNIKDSFKTEAQKSSDIQKDINEALKIMANMGQLMLVMVSNFAALSIISMKTMLALDYSFEGTALKVAGVVGATLGTVAGGPLGGVAGLTSGIALAASALPQSEKTQGIKAKFNTYWNNAATAGVGVLEDGQRLTSATGPLGKIMNPMITPIVKALRFGGLDTYDPANDGGIQSDEDKIANGLFNEKGDEGTQQSTHRRNAPDVVNVALSKVGHHQKGNEASELSFNRVEWWCMDFVGWAYEQAGFTDWGDMHKSMWTDQQLKGYKGIEAWARKTGNWHEASGYVPKPGDVFFLQRYSGDQGVNLIGEHVGMVVDVMEDGTLLTVEGNAAQHGVNGVWQHRRDPAVTSFRGFISTKMSGKSHASVDAKSTYLMKVEKTILRKKKNQAATKYRKIAQAYKMSADLDAEAIRKGKISQSAEDFTSHAGGSDDPDAPMIHSADATLTQSADGIYSVNVTLKFEDNKPTLSDPGLEMQRQLVEAKKAAQGATQ